jgi:hypothetical protein
MNSVAVMLSRILIGSASKRTSFQKHRRIHEGRKKSGVMITWSQEACASTAIERRLIWRCVWMVLLSIQQSR